MLLDLWPQLQDVVAEPPVTPPVVPPATGGHGAGRHEDHEAVADRELFPFVPTIRRVRDGVERSPEPIVSRADLENLLRRLADAAPLPDDHLALLDFRAEHPRALPPHDVAERAVAAAQARLAADNEDALLWLLLSD